MFRALISIFYLPLALSLFASCATPTPMIKARNFEVQGHRGARAVRPENTLSAFRYALSIGVDTLEMDLNVTKDGVLVITHDPFINPEICMDGDGNVPKKKIMVRSLTLKQLKKFDCGSMIHPRFPAQVVQRRERIPTFEELLKWLAAETDPRAKSILLNVETKSEAEHPEFTPAPKVFSKMVIDLAKKYGVFGRMTLQSFDYRTIIAAREIDPTIVTTALVENRPSVSLAEVATSVKADIISPNCEWLTRLDVESLHAIGKRVIPWTANTPDEWTKLVSFGVDGIISDDPLPLLEFRARLLKSSSPSGK